MKEYRPTSEDGNVDIMWPRDELVEAMRKNLEVDIEVPTKMPGVYEIVNGKVESFGVNYFIMPLEVLVLNKPKASRYTIAYSVVHSIEVLHPAPVHESLAEGMWKLVLDYKDDDVEKTVMAELRDGRYESILDIRTSSPIDVTIAAHNTVIKRLNERTTRQVCEDSGIPIKMTGDGLEMGDADSDDQFRNICMANLHYLYKADSGKDYGHYGHLDDYAFYLQEGDQKHKLPIISYAKVTDTMATVMNIYGHTIEVPAEMFHAIWTRKDDGS